MIKIEIYEDSGQLSVNGMAVELMTEEEYQQVEELGKNLNKRMMDKKQKRLSKMPLSNAN